MLNYQIVLIPTDKPIPIGHMSYGNNQKDFIEILTDTVRLIVRPKNLSDSFAQSRAERVLEEHFGTGWNEFLHVGIMRKD